MTAAQLADKLLSDEHADVLRHSVAWMARELMEADVTQPTGRRRGQFRQYSSPCASIGAGLLEANVP
jgi:hypothetical protein